MRISQARILARRTWPCIQSRRCSSTPSAPAINWITKLPDGPARTRFAPSPTGYLHLGSLRTALFNYLLAKRTGGQFVLRLEDTDMARTVPDGEERLYEDLQWAGLNWDEGPGVGGPYGPYLQSKRKPLYRSYAKDLMANGHAYRCFCHKDELRVIASQRNDAGLPAGYDRKCAQLSAEESDDRAAKKKPYTIRFKFDEHPTFTDMVYGKISRKTPRNENLDFTHRVYEDPIIIKSNGSPTYHLANVVDDHCMKITHVLRGNEWMTSTPIHTALYNAFKWTPPHFGHLPLLVDQSGAKLSKRNADMDISFYRNKRGMFASPLVNFAALLGWSHKEKSDILSLKELEERFNLKITKGNTTVSFGKLRFLHGKFARDAVTSGGPNFDYMVNAVSSAVQKMYPLHELRTILNGRALTEYVAPIIRVDAKNYSSATGFARRNFGFFTQKLDRPSYTPAPNTLRSSSEIPMQALHTAVAAVTLVPPSHWSAETLQSNIQSYVDSETVLPPTADRATVFKYELYHYFRWALLASAEGPGVSDAMEFLGRDESLRRLEEAKTVSQNFGPGRKNPLRRSV